MPSESGSTPSIASLLDQALRPETTPETFLTRLLPALHQHMQADFDRWIDATVNVGVRVAGAAGGTWTLAVSADGMTVAEGRAVERPLFTVRVAEADWGGIREFLEGFPSEIEEILALRIPAPGRRIDRGILDAIAALEAALDLVLENVFADGPARASILLGRWDEDPRARVRLLAHIDDVEDLLDRAVTPMDLWRDGCLRADGDTAILARIGTLLTPVFAGLLRS